MTCFLLHLCDLLQSHAWSQQSMHSHLKSMAQLSQISPSISFHVQLIDGHISPSNNSQLHFFYLKVNENCSHLWCCLCTAYEDPPPLWPVSHSWQLMALMSPPQHMVLSPPNKQIQLNGLCKMYQITDSLPSEAAGFCWSPTCGFLIEKTNINVMGRRN